MKYNQISISFDNENKLKYNNNWWMRRDNNSNFSQVSIGLLIFTFSKVLKFLIMDIKTIVEYTV